MRRPRAGLRRFGPGRAASDSGTRAPGDACVERTIRLTAAAVALSCAGGTWADASGMGMGRMRGPTFLRQLFPPTLIMQHQSDIGLTGAQRDAITKEMTDTQKAVLDLRWQLE